MGQDIHNCVCCPTGYSAGKGWDPVSGLGSIRFGIIEPLLLGMMPAASASVVLPAACSTVAQSVCQQSCGPGYAGPFVSSGTCDAAGSCRTAAPPAGGSARATGIGIGIGIGISICAGLAGAGFFAWRRQGQRPRSGVAASAFAEGQRQQQQEQHGNIEMQGNNPGAEVVPGSDGDGANAI
jgi:hypothetical protein